MESFICTIENKEITSEDLELFQDVQDVIGACIDNANQFSELMRIIIDLNIPISAINDIDKKFSEHVKSRAKLINFMKSKNIKQNRNMSDFDAILVKNKQREHFLKDIYDRLKSKKY